MIRVISRSHMRRLFVGVGLFALCFTSPIAFALERDTVDRFFREYDHVRGKVARLSEDLQKSDRRADVQQVLTVLDQLRAARDHLARYDAAHQMTAYETKGVFMEHSKLRALFYAYEAMAQMLSAQIDYKATKAESLQRLAERYRQTWQEADGGIRIPSAP